MGDAKFLRGIIIALSGIKLQSLLAKKKSIRVGKNRMMCQIELVCPRNDQTVCDYTM